MTAVAIATRAAGKYGAAAAGPERSPQIRPRSLDQPPDHEGDDERQGRGEDHVARQPEAPAQEGGRDEGDRPEREPVVEELPRAFEEFRERVDQVDQRLLDRRGRSVDPGEGGEAENRRDDE